MRVKTRTQLVIMPGSQVVPAGTKRTVISRKQLPNKSGNTATEEATIRWDNGITSIAFRPGSLENIDANP